MSGAGSWHSRDHGALARELGRSRSEREVEDVERLGELLGIVYRLRDPDGCPWDREQTVESMARNLIEEAYEAVEAIAAGDDAHVAEELGDTLMNVLLMTRIATQDERFDMTAVAGGIAEKLVRRHPHVFGDGAADDASEALVSWNESKARETAADGVAPSVLDRVSHGLPALLAALKLGEKAAGVGFDWPDSRGALDKLREELDELEEACPPGPEGASAERMAAAEDELGDVLFSAVNVARKLGLDPELALRRTLDKFRRRFASLEQTFGDQISETSLEELEAAWRREADGESSGRPATMDP
jgi:MazG family protein